MWNVFTIHKRSLQPSNSLTVRWTSLQAVDRWVWGQWWVSPTEPCELQQYLPCFLHLPTCCLHQTRSCRWPVRWLWQTAAHCHQNSSTQPENTFTNHIISEQCSCFIQQHTVRYSVKLTWQRPCAVVHISDVQSSQRHTLQLNVTASLATPSWMPAIFSTTANVHQIMNRNYFIIIKSPCLNMIYNTTANLNEL